MLNYYDRAAWKAFRPGFGYYEPGVGPSGRLKRENEPKSARITLPALSASTAVTIAGMWFLMMFQLFAERATTADFRPAGSVHIRAIGRRLRTLRIRHPPRPDVWTPAKSATDRLPVMVWIHGGGFALGSGSRPSFDGEALARRGVVLVTLNYRLGALGFLAHPALSRESARGVSGNYGLLDQIAALCWVQNNVARFGGDPSDVTVSGQSGGACSICIFMVSPMTKGLFRRAIVRSLPLMFQPAIQLQSAEVEGETKAPDIAALRKVSAERILKQVAARPTLSAGFRLFPVVDGWLLPKDPADLIGTTRQASMPVLIGYTAHEGKFFLGTAPRSISGFQTFVQSKFGVARLESILAMYPAKTDTDAPNALGRLFGDYELITSTVLTARAMARIGDVHLYQFARVGPLSRSLWNGATHTSEFPYVFDYITAPSADFEPQDKAVSEAMVGAWVRFAKTGDPN